MAKLIGTAGHVDHGKTSLIKALTGIDADRLPEEKRRGMTIDIGFAYVDLPGHGRVSIVDVPGHERFITNMLVGALGIDVALLCVAADESVMPQTREHLQILELLPVERLVVALTRADLADSETREIATAEVEELIGSSRFQSAPIIPVSVITGEGLPLLKSELSDALSVKATETEHRDPNAPWYLPIDRVFTIKGHGCVVTGTLAQGMVKVGDRAFLQPGRFEVRIRGIQTHGESEDRSEQGRRTALNLSGVKEEGVRRGMALGGPNALFETRMFDARVRWVGEIKHGQRVRVSIGAEEVIGKAFLNDAQSEIVQFRLETPVAAALHQPVIIRRYSPPDLLGGGRVAVPVAKVRRRKDTADVVPQVDSSSAILSVLGDLPNGVTTEEICRRLGSTPQALGDVFESMSKKGLVRGFAGLWFSQAGFHAGQERFLEGLAKAHQQHATRAVVARELAVKAGNLLWTGKPLDRIMSALSTEGVIEAHGTNVRLKGFTVQLPARQREMLDRVKAALEAEEINVPPPDQLAKTVGVPSQAIDEILKTGVQTGEIVALGEGVFYTPDHIARLKERLRQVAGGKPFTASAVRDAMGTTRKYVIPLLEHFDATRFTTRLGDSRVVNE